MTGRRKVVLERAVALLVAVCIVFTLIDAVGDETNWYKIAFCVLAAVLLIDWLRPKRAEESPQPIDPSSVSQESVDSAIATTDGRIPAIKRLRERHPGLGLKDAKDLVDDRLPSPDR